MIVLDMRVWSTVNKYRMTQWKYIIIIYIEDNLKGILVIYFNI